MAGATLAGLLTVASGPLNTPTLSPILTFAATPTDSTPTDSPTATTDVANPVPTPSTTDPDVTQPVPSSSSTFSPAPSSSFLAPSPSSSFSSLHSTPNASTDSFSTSPSPSSHSSSWSSPSPGAFITTAIVTTIGGKATTIYSEIPIPTTLASSKSLSPSRRTALIVSAALGSLFLLILALSLFFLYKRRQSKMGFTDSLTSRRKQQKVSRAMLLQGEDLDDDNMPPPTPSPLLPPSRHPHSPYMHSLGTRSITSQSSMSQVPRLLPARGSETGSIFHEGVWPPPGENSRLVDPLTQASSQVDLSTIVDDVMGPSSSHQNTRNGGGGYYSSSHGDLSPTFSLDSPITPDHDSRDPSAFTATGHPYDWSNTSQTPLWSPGSNAIGGNSDNSNNNNNNMVVAGQYPPQHPRYPSPLARQTLIIDSDQYRVDRGSYVSASTATSSPPPSPRNWLERSPAKQISKQLDKGG